MTQPQRHYVLLDVIQGFTIYQLVATASVSLLLGLGIGLSTVSGWKTGLITLPGIVAILLVYRDIRRRPVTRETLCLACGIEVNTNPVKNPCEACQAIESTQIQLAANGGGDP